MKLLLSTMPAALLFVLVFSNTGMAALQCNDCHGTSSPTDFRPIDSASRNIATGGFQGNHRTHLGSGVSVSSCNTCHGNGTDVGTYPSKHRNGRIEMVANINNSPKAGGAVYSKGVFFNQTSVPILGSCSNVNCHFEATTPTWGSTAFTSPNDCNKCHGAPPSGGSTGAAGSHARHDLYYAGTSNCQKCHSNNTTFIHATSAAKRNLNISFAAAPNNGSGAYSGPLNDYLPSQTNVFGNCTATYCHSPGTKASAFNPPNITATWGTPLPANCTGCHKSDYSSSDGIATGSHSRHISGLAPFNYDLMKCDKCHAVTGTVSMTIANTANHVDGQVQIAFKNSTSAANGFYKGTIATPASPTTKAPGSAYGTCTNVYCHSSGQGANGTWPPAYQSPTWGTPASGQCGTCHGEQISHGGFSLVTPLTTGSHTKHLQNGIINTSSPYERCVGCHAYGRVAFDPGNCNMLCHSPTNKKHINYEINVDIPTNYGATANYNGTAKPGDGYSNCSNVSCHFNTTTPAWGTSTPINCFGCHSLAQLMASGSHSKHISNSLIPTMYNYTSNRSTAVEYDFGCSNCHPVAASNHMNGAVNVTLKKDEAGIGVLRTKNSATAAGIGVVNSGINGTTKTNVVCTAAYCHSNGNSAALVYASTPNWYGGSFTGDKCANCHGNAPNNTIAGSKSHYNNKFLGYTSTVGGHQIGIHAMKIYSSPGGLAKAGTVGSSSHGNAGTSTTISCNICHYATVTTARNDSNAVCKTCHVSGNTVGAQFGNQIAIANMSKHVNGTVDIAFQPVNVLSKAQMRTASFNQSAYSSAWKRNVGYKKNGAYDSAKSALNTASMWDSSTKTCSNIACHNGQSVKWNDNNGATDCISCHTAL